MKLNSLIESQLLLVLFIGLFVNGLGLENVYSSQLQKYSISQCHPFKKFCWNVEGRTGFIDSTSSIVAAKDVILTIKKTENQNLFYKCNSFIFNLNSGIIVCDNSEFQDSISVFIDKGFDIKEFKK